MIDVTDATTKIIDLFKSKNVDLMKAKKGQSKIDINKELSDLVNNYGISLAEAERTIVNKYAKENNVIIYTNQARSNAIRDINTINLANEWVTVEAKVISANKTQNNKIFMKAVIADHSGAIPVTLWSRKIEEPRLPEIKPDKWYRISNAVVNGYNNTLSLSVVKTTTIDEISEKSEMESSFTHINELGVGIYNIKGKVVQLFESKSDKLHQVGLIGDSTGIVKFVSWASSNPTTLEKGKVYSFNYVQSQKYNNMMSITISESKEIGETIDVPSNQSDIIGNLVSIKVGSGLIKRCKVDGCTRVLTRQNYCSIHEIQPDFKYDMRIKGIIDDGFTAYNVIMTLPIVEKISGMSLEEAIKIAENNPLGADEVMIRLQSLLVGRYFQITGTIYPDRVFVVDANRLEYDFYKKHTGLTQTSKQTSLGGV